MHTILGLIHYDYSSYLFKQSAWTHPNPENTELFMETAALFPFHFSLGLGLIKFEFKSVLEKVILDLCLSLHSQIIIVMQNCTYGPISQRLSLSDKLSENWRESSVLAVSLLVQKSPNGCIPLTVETFSKCVFLNLCTITFRDLQHDFSTVRIVQYTFGALN